MKQKILVTGGAGFIGSHLVDELVERRYDVRVFDNLDFQVHNGRLPDYLNPKAEYFFGDIRDKEVLRRALADVEVIFHNAAIVGVGQSMYEIQRYVDVNSYGTAKLLDILANEEHDVKKLVVASSMSIYGEGSYLCDDCGVVYPNLRSDKQFKAKEWEMLCPKCRKKVKPIPTDEDKTLNPTSIYAIVKRDQEEMSLIVGKAYGIPTVALRYFNTYGPRQSLSNPYTGVCAIFLSRIKNGNAPTIFEDGLQTRDFISVHDIVKANILAMKESRAKYKAFNVGTGYPTSILDIVWLLNKVFKKDAEPKVVNKYRSGDIRHCYADISKIEEIGFKPTVGFRQGMVELVDWGAEIDAEDKFGYAYEELKKKGLTEG